MPITRPLGLVYPDDEQAWAADQEFLVGQDLLAAPVSADRAERDGRLGRPTPVDVYLPEGQWVDAFTGEVFSGGQHVVRSSGLDDFPLYIRQGSAMPFDWRTPDIWSKPWGLNDLGRSDRAGWVYAPRDGARYDAHAQSPSSGGFTGRTRGATVRVSLEGAPKQTEVLVPTTNAPTSVMIDGRPVRSAGSVAGLRGAAQGWAYQDKTFGGGGVLLKLAPSAGGSQVEPTFPGPPGRDVRTPVSVTVQPDGELVAGRQSEVTTTFTNAATSGAPLQDVRLDLPAPGGWRVAPDGAHSFDRVLPGQTVRATWQVTPVVGQAYLSAMARYKDPAAGADVTALSPSTQELVKASGDLLEVTKPAKLASLEWAAVGAPYYADRDFTITTLPDALAGQLLIPGAKLGHQ